MGECSACNTCEVVVKMNADEVESNGRHWPTSLILSIRGHEFANQKPYLSCHQFPPFEFKRPPADMAQQHRVQCSAVSDARTSQVPKISWSAEAGKFMGEISSQYCGQRAE
jgi:hypothetical protein